MSKKNMEDKIIGTEDSSPEFEVKPPSIWKWYFGQPQLFYRIPVLLIFVWCGVWFVLTQIQNILYFFNYAEVTWGRIFIILIMLGFFSFFFILPTFGSFVAIQWFYEINIGPDSVWKKFFYSIGLILLVIIGVTLINLLNTWLLGIL